MMQGSLTATQLLALAHQHGVARKLTVALFATACVGAHAQEPPTRSQTDDKVEEIVVTAQKREQTLLEVPLSVTAITEEVLERQNIDSFIDYAIRVPNLTFDQAGVIGYRGDTSITIRGVQGLTNYYFDETPVPITDVRLFDIQRVEILRGPQGTLYGDAAMGGTVKLVTNKPSVEGFEGGGSVSYGSISDGGDQVTFEAFANIPISDRSAVRVAAYDEEIGGYIDNIPPSQGLGDQSGGILPFDVTHQEDVNSGTRRGVRGALRFAATEEFTIDASIWLQEIDLGMRSLYDEPTPLETAFRGTFFEQQDMELYNVTLSWERDRLGVVSSTTYYDIETINSEDITIFLAQGLFGFDQSAFTNPQQLNNAFPSDGWSHETRLFWDGQLFDNPMFVTAGVFYQDREFSRDQYWFDSQSIEDINRQFDPDGSSGFDFGAAFDALGVERGLWGFQLLPNEVQQLAFFGDVSIRLTDRVELSAGLRFYDYDVSETRTVDGFLFQGREVSSGTTTDNGVNPRVGLKIDLSDSSMLYLNAAKGFNIGSALGSALPSICDPVLEREGLSDGPVDPETLWSYELGLKGRFLKNRLELEAAAFYVDWQDIQETVGFEDNECPEGLLGNFGEADIYGGEITFTVYPAEGLTIGGAFGYSDADRSRAAIGASAAERVGNTLLTSTVQFEYAFPVAARINAYFGGDYQYIEEGENDEPGTPHYDVANLRVGLVSADKKWEAAVFAKNVGNSNEALLRFAPGSIGNLLPQIGILQPRTIGVEIRTRF